MKYLILFLIPSIALGVDYSAALGKQINKHQEIIDGQIVVIRDNPTYLNLRISQPIGQGFSLYADHRSYINIDDNGTNSLGIVFRKCK